MKKLHTIMLALGAAFLAYHVSKRSFTNGTLHQKAVLL